MASLLSAQSRSRAVRRLPPPRRLHPHVSFWEAGLLLARVLPAYPTVTTVKLLVSWSYSQKRHGRCRVWQWNNPLNVRTPWGDDTRRINSAGVNAYWSRADGVAATVITLWNGEYPTIFQALRTGDTALFFRAQDELTRWGADVRDMADIYARLADPLDRFVWPAPPRKK